MKRIYIAIPVYQFPTPECVESVINLVAIFRNKYDIKVRLISGYSADVARTKATVEFLKSDCDYLLFVDSDIILNESAIEHLIEADKEIVTAIYNKKTNIVHHSEVYKIENGKFTAYNTQDVPNENFEVIACGFGCVLIKRDVIRKVFEATNGIPFKFIQGNPYVSEDVYFCNECSKLGIKIIADGRAKVGHVGKFLF